MWINGRKVAKLMYFDSDSNPLMGIFNEFYSLSASLFAFSVKMQDYAMNAVCANHSYVLGNSSSLEKLRDSEGTFFDKEILPCYKKELNKYYSFDMKPIEKFGKCISKKSGHKRILFYLNNIGMIKNGTSVHAFSALKGMINSSSNAEYEFVLWGKTDILQTSCPYDISKCRIITSDELDRDTEIYDVGFVPSHMIAKNDLQIMLNACYKHIFWPLDMIMIRSSYIAKTEYLSVMEYIARYSDGLLFSTKSVERDFTSYFSNISNISRIPLKISHICPKNDNAYVSRAEIPFTEYYLVMGNSFLHKMIVPTFYTLMDVEENFIILGGSEECVRLSNRIMLYRSGSLSDDFMSTLFQNCKGLIFPSIYEGFGLPPVEAMNLGKNIFVMDTPINHELEELAPEFSNLIHYMESLDELPGLLEKMKDYNDNLLEVTISAYNRTWDDVGTDCMDIIEKALLMPYEEEKIIMRKAFALSCR